LRNLQDDALNARENAILYARYAKRGFSTPVSLRTPADGPKKARRRAARRNRHAG
jgi:hypothetical protein